ncbi:MAG: antitoxin [Gammaproteobacteria bacterium]|nr:antitoxin [Gammaproteobacteria bacterium]
MYTANLRKVGGSVMLAVPPVLLSQLELEVGSEVSLSIEGGVIVMHPNPKPRYTLKELLAASDYSEKPSKEDAEWTRSPRAGKETL